MNITITPTPKGDRVWVQGADRFGLTVGQRVSVEFTEYHIRVTPNPEGKKRISKGKGGIVDIQSAKVTAWAKGDRGAQVLPLASGAGFIIEREGE